ncbi:MAG: phosphoribosylglycinamide formyltransferase [Cyanobacteria bacterium P01_D01_bin.1]
MPPIPFALISPLVTSHPATRPAAKRPPVKLGIMASGSGSNFEAIASAITAGTLDASIEVVIYNNPKAKVVDRANRLGIPAKLLNHRTFDSREQLDEAIVSTFQDFGVNWVVMAGWMRRVTQRLISAFPNQILNIHPSLLPSFPGTHAIEQALAAKVRITGCSVHHVELIVDSGPIIMQAAVPVLANDSVETLQARIQVQEHLIFPQAIALATGQASERIT